VYYVCIMSYACSGWLWDTTRRSFGLVNLYRSSHADNRDIEFSLKHYSHVTIPYSKLIKNSECSNDILSTASGQPNPCFRCHSNRKLPFFRQGSANFEKHYHAPSGSPTHKKSSTIKMYSYSKDPWPFSKWTHIPTNALYIPGIPNNAIQS
jgi:hypothetical protein